MSDGAITIKDDIVYVIGEMYENRKNDMPYDR